MGCASRLDLWGLIQLMHPMRGGLNPPRAFGAIAPAGAGVFRPRGGGGECGPVAFGRPWLSEMPMPAIAAAHMPAGRA